MARNTGRVLIVLLGLALSLAAYYRLFGTPLVDAVSVWTAFSTATVLGLLGTSVTTDGTTGLGIHADVLHFGPVPALALVAATPNIGIARMTARLADSAGLFLALHVVGLSVLFSLLWGALESGDTLTSVGAAMTGFAIFWALVPGVLAGAWCYRYWLPYLRGRDRIVSGERAL